jgi:hypothetical protein
VDAICLQETIRSDFSPWDLNLLSGGESFEWVWTAASGHSGGTLTGVKTTSVIVVAQDRGVFFSLA